MSDHCPFLNRSDRRCSEYFQLSHLQHAFEFCFDDYQTCPVYAEQLAERQGDARRRRERREQSRGKHASSASLVTLTLPARYAQPQRAA